MKPIIKTKRNFYVSYLKGFAIISIMLIHLIDWSNRSLVDYQLYLRELLYPGVMFFIATAGSVIYLAYMKYNWRISTRKLFRRGSELVGLYFLYNIVKLYIYNFPSEPFYAGFTAANKLNLISLLELKSFTVPITIILTIGILLLVSPIFLWLARQKYPKLIFGGLIAALVVLNYLIPLPTNSLIDFLYAKNNVMFPLMLWLLPYLIGIYLAMIGLEKHKGKLLLLFSGLTISAALAPFGNSGTLKLTDNMYPLELYYVCFSFAFMYLLIYIFYFLEKLSQRFANFFLALFRLMGDSTLGIYLYHWLVIDLTLCLFFPKTVYIWLTVILFIAIYVGAKNKKLKEYYKNY